MKIKASIRTRLITTFVLLTIIPLLILSLVLSAMNFKTQYHQVIDFQYEVKKSIISKVQFSIHELDGIFQATIIINNLPKKSQKQQFSILSQLRSIKGKVHRDIIEELTILNKYGQERARVSRTINFTTKDLKSRAQKNEFRIPATKRRAYYSPVSIDSVTGEPVMIFSRPIFNPQKGSISSVLVAKIRIHKFWGKIIKRETKQSGILYIMNRKGMVIAHPDSSVIFRHTFLETGGKPAIRTNTQGRKVISSNEKFLIGEETFYIGMEMPLFEALHPAITSITTMTLFIAIFLIISLILGFLAVRHVVRPIESLADTAKAIASGALNRKADISGDDEIAALAHSFNLMVSRLLHDIEERKRAEAALRISEKKYRTIMDTTQDAILLMDSEGLISFGNPSACKIFGYSKEEMIGRELHSFLAPSKYHKNAQKGIEIFKATGTGYVIGKTMELEALTKTNVLFPIELSLSSMQIEGKWNAVGILRDITARKQSEEALHLSHIKLEKRVQERTAELAKLNEELQAEVIVREIAEKKAAIASKAKGDFLANMSHEIRTPLNGIIGMTNLTLSSDLSKQQNHYLTIVQNSAMSLLDIINDILDFSKIEAEQLILEKSPFDLLEVIEKTMQINTAQTLEKGLELLYHLPPEVPSLIIGDALRLRQILVNLVSNAIKFTHQGYVYIEIGLEQENEKEITLSFKIEDTGIGIPKEKQASIFQSFSQADNSTSRLYGGTGLGLSISQKLISLMDGNIVLESSPENGSIFSFSIPFEKPAPWPEENIKNYHFTNEYPVLLYDTLPLSQKVFKELLSEWGIKVTVTDNGEKIPELLSRASRTGKPYKILIINLPNRQNYKEKILADLDRDENFPVIPIVLWSPIKELNPAPEYLNLNIVCILPKPPRKYSLYQAIQTALGNKEEDISDKTESKKLTENSLTNESVMNILLVEDNLMNQEIAVLILQQAGHNVQIASNGKEALEILSQNSFDLIFMDVQMPGMDGPTVTRIIRKSEEGKIDDSDEYSEIMKKINRNLQGVHTPIIAMTAHAFEDVKKDCREAGMEHYISKPFLKDDLIDLIKQIQETNLFE